MVPCGKSRRSCSVRLAAVLALTLTLLLTANPVLDDARAHLRHGNVNAVYLDLEGSGLVGDDARAGAQILVAAAQEPGADDLMAFSLARLALRLSPENLDAQAIATRKAMALEKWRVADALAEQWAQQSGAPEPRLIQAEAALRMNEAARALKVLPASDRFPVELRTRAESVRQRAAAGAAAEAKRPVIVYGTSWCPACRVARRWLRANRVPFREVDIEQDAAAARELELKKARASVEDDVIPIVDVRGSLVVGFDEERMSDLLAPHR